MAKDTFMALALDKFSGFDNTEREAGSPGDPAIWLLGLEHGTYRSRHENAYNGGGGNTAGDDGYSVEMQMRWPYNKKAFKLLAAMDSSYGVKRYREFARHRQPFVKGSRGYFKGNLYPFPCNRFDSWNSDAELNTGFASKKDYLRWCRDNRLPVVHSWVNAHAPEIIIGVGIGSRKAFSRAVFGSEVELGEHRFYVNGHRKRLFYRVEGDRKLVVVPHFSGSHGLNSDESLQLSGEFISSVLEGGTCGD